MLQRNPFLRKRIIDHQVTADKHRTGDQPKAIKCFLINPLVWQSTHACWPTEFLLPDNHACHRKPIGKRCRVPKRRSRRASQGSSGSTNKAERQRIDRFRFEVNDSISDSSKGRSRSNESRTANRYIACRSAKQNQEASRTESKQKEWLAATSRNNLLARATSQK